MKKTSRLYQISHSGFSLIQVLISIGVMSIDSSTFGPISRKELISKVANFQSQ